VCHGSCVAALSPTPSRGWPCLLAPPRPAPNNYSVTSGKAPRPQRDPRGCDAPRRHRSARGGRQRAEERISLPRILKRDEIADLPIAGCWRASHRSSIFLHINPTLIDRDTTAAPEWIEMSCRLEHRTVVEVGRDSIEDVDAGIVRVEPERPERFMAATSARVGSTSSSTTPTTRGLRRPARRHSAIPRTASTLGAVTAPATLRATSEDSGRRRRSGGGRAPARGRSMSLTGRRHRMLDQSVVQSRHATRPGCAASTPRGARHAQTYP
jgi:hypothetical protein